ncbi:MAG TPA: hypothetical protein VIS74_03845 [Chthoniobacterales bacterium]
MKLIDWLLIALPIAIVVGIALYTRRYVRSVTDFMAGGRCAGRYLLSTAGSEMTAGAALFVATLEQFSVTGFTIQWWSQILTPVGLLLAITGFVGYRYRQTRALTLGQFFEMRYSRNFRLYAGVLGFLAGIINFGVIPAVEARFFVHFLNLPATLPIFSLAIPTDLLLMTLFLALAVLLPMVGGQVTMLVVGCAEGMISQIFYVIIAIVMVSLVTWSQMSQVLMAQPAGHSMVNPFDTFQAQDFNLWFVLMLAFLNIYGTMAWQKSQAFNASPITPHEGRMGGILYRWRYFASGTMMLILSLCTLTFMQHPDFAAGAAHAKELTDAIPNAKVADQMDWPIALSLLLPAGIKGMLCAIVLMGLIASNGMAMHSWGGIFIQDVVVPLRKTPLTTAQHLLVLRLAIFGVAIFAFIFGALFQQTDKLLLWWALTQAIFVGGAGAAIIGGLYWKRGTAAGAWSGMLTGSILSVGGIIFRQVYPEVPVNGMQISFFAALIAIVVYVTVSRLTSREPHDMDRLLNRGKYAVEAEDSGHAIQKTSWLTTIIGIDKHFTRSDRWITYGISGWSYFWFFLFIFGSAVYLIHPWSNEAWLSYWHISNIILPLIIAVLTTIWFTIGGVVDLRKFFQRLRAERVDAADDGTVSAEDTGKPESAK